MNGWSKRIPGDWFPGTLPENILLGEGAHVETSYSFLRYRSEADCGLRVGRGAALYAPILDVGPRGKVTVGDFALITSAMILCDIEVVIGPMAMLAWGVALMDSYRVTGDARTRQPARGSGQVPDGAGKPIHIGTNAWLGFECCVLPGVTIGDNSVVAARAVVVGDVPPGTLVAGNPARIIRQL